ncbi:5'-methylthioadenosine/S-adenosylhomocysteine nucleosidase [Pleurocapsa sp. PCC 7319]|uniref:5'-methylthioadenosine/S-adenosylhomocysteine nucleosidase n=1 Tax=Pleurocapsa sp. PCC 7319 TaxID=118161 RepID=UPI000348450B|nr:5'-methylthioadenosine/S-adenosylhomocysteine nucleosidase [Pleurocapsa sp. PCC 7319]
MKTAILTPLKEELAILVTELERFGLNKQELRLGNIDIFEFCELDLLVACGGHGKTQFGIQAQYLLCQAPQIDLLVCAGVAGALSNSLNIGDVVVATETVEHDYNLKFISRPLPRFAGDPQIIEVLQNLSQMNSAFSIHFGGVASGDEDIIDAVRGQELMNLTDCIAVAWEGAGGARACQFSEKHYVELRSVTDTANHQAAADFEANLVIAMHNLAEIIVRWRASIKKSRASIKSADS